MGANTAGPRAPGRVARRSPPPAPGSRGDARARRWAFERLSREIRVCTLCPLSKSRQHAVVYRGSLAPRVVFVGEAPGADEDREGLPFVGRSGRLLDAAIARIGPTLGSFGVLNVLKCRPPANRFDASAARTCRPYLDRQLALLRPRLLVPLGARALVALDPQAPPILSAAGRARLGRAGRLFPLLHPAAALRSRRWHARWDSDVAALAEWLARGALETL
jgi:uracil-DNA glycosylase